MGIFSKSSRPGSDREQRVETGTEASDIQEIVQVSEMSNVEHLSPFALKMQEKMNHLDVLKSRVGGLNQTFEQMAAFAAESQTSIRMMAEYLEGSRTSVETEVRLKSENAKISTDLLDAEHMVRTLTTQLEDAQAEVHSLRKRATETRTALETARNDIVSIRDNNKKVNEEYRLQSAKLVEANSQVSDLTGKLTDLQAKFDTLEKHSESLGSDLEAVRHREKELQQNLSESAKLLEDEVRKNNQVTSELESVKRELVEFRNDNIDLKSHLDVANQEHAYAKSRLEEEQRKHDNEVYALNAEIENLSSQRRIGAQSLQEMARENSTLKERSRDLLKRMQEIEHLLDSAQKNHEKDRNELMATSAKLREVNLRYNSALTDLNHQRNQNKKYADNLEDLIEENKRLQRYKIQVDTANEQIVQLKSVIANYQMAMEGRGPAEELGLTEGYDPAAELGITEPMTSASEPSKNDDAGSDDDGPDGNTPGGGDDKIVKLRD
jgi:predicted  nucleic acid-binding Zn-ribbon protein